ncbi:MAG: archaemetzincin family Zn-dependent metalloprotease [Desulfobacterales bacterium]|nr:archaemetzincin family Zn-dependent metalloprotease [Desulfobacterales bacterium]
MTPAPGHTVLIMSGSDLAGELAATVAAAVQTVFGCATALHPLSIDLAFAYDAAREQYHSTPILRRLADAAPEGALKIIALVEVDLFIPILTHVYGEAQLGGKACIVSSYRLTTESWRPDGRDRFQRRMLKESIHELGHTFNLRHCSDPKCIMHYCRSEADVDRKSEELCRYCRILLLDEIRKLTAW